MKPKSTPIVNDAAFSDSHAISGGNPPIMAPTIGSPQASFNPGLNAAALPNGPPKYIQPKGKKPLQKGLTNKRITQNV